MSAIKMLKGLTQRLLNNAPAPMVSAELSFSEYHPYILIEDEDDSQVKPAALPVAKVMPARIAGEHCAQLSAWYDSIDCGEFEVNEGLLWFDHIAREEFFGLNGLDAIPTCEFTISDITRNFDYLATREFTISQISSQFDHLGTREFVPAA